MQVKRLCFCLVVVGLLAAGCAAPTPTATATPAASATPTRAVLPTAVDTYFGAPATYERMLGNHKQVIRLGVSADFGTRPILPLYGLSLTDPKLTDRLFEVLTRNHFYRWQEVDWQNRALVTYDEFVQRLNSGQDLRYPAMDTRNGGGGAHVENISPAADMDILIIPRHDGFVTFPAGPTDPGLSIKNTINSDGSVTVRVPLVYAQVITFKKGDAALQELARNSLIIALMELSIPPAAIRGNDLSVIKDWWETKPDKDLHRAQYTRLQKLLTDDVTQKPILHLWDVQP